VPGHGLVGMRERVRAFGGRLTAGPRSDGRFSVLAAIPAEGGSLMGQRTAPIILLIVLEIIATPPLG
jgi:hypothetical protein